MSQKTNRNYWLDLFTGTTWKEFLDAGAEVSGFRENRWKTVQKIKPGDYLLCYLTGVSRWIAILEVTSEPFKDDTQIWKDEKFPCRIKVQSVVTLTPETAIPVRDLKDRLSAFQNMKSPNAWTGRFRGSPAKWRESDGEAVLEALIEAERNPQERPVDPKKLARRPRALKTTIGAVTVPEDTEQPGESEAAQTSRPPKDHDEIQWLLLKLGSDMGLDIWVARNDRNRQVAGQRFADLPRLKQTLPLQFDEGTNRTIELIDVLWLRKNNIVAAFEIESTTSVYSGLLRLSDLITMQPNLNIPLYIVAPDDRRDKVINEVNRATFSRLSPPMADMCKFISFSALREGVSRASTLTRYLKPDFIEEFAESCEAEQPHA